MIEPEFNRLRKSIDLTFDPHVFIRQTDRNFDVGFVEDTVRTGEILLEKSDPPRKLCFKKYHGKERMTYVVIAIIHQDFIEVKTTWLTKGN